MSRFKALSMVAKQSLIFTAIVVSFILFSIMGAYYFSSNLLEKEVNKLNFALLNQINSNIDMILLEIERDLLNITYDVNVKNFVNNSYESIRDRNIGIISLQKAFNELINTNDRIHSIYLYSYAGDMLLSNNAFSDRDDFFDTGWIEVSDSMRGSSFWFGTHEIHDENDIRLSNGNNVITLIRKYTSYHDNVKTHGLIAANVSEDVLTNSIITDGENNSNQILIIDDKATIISSNDKNMLYTDFFEVESGNISKLNLAEGMVDEIYNGSESRFYFITSKHTNWSYISVQPFSKLKMPQVIMRKLLFSLVIILTILTIIVTFFVSKKTYGSFEHFFKIISEKVDKFGSYESNAKHNKLKNLELKIDKVLQQNTDMQKALLDSVMYSKKWRIMTELLFGKIKNPDMFMEDIALLNISLYSTNYIVLIAEICEDEFKTPHNTRAVSDKIEQIVNEVCKGIAIDIETGKVVAILSFGASKQEYFKTVTLVAEAVKKYCCDKIGCNALISIGSNYKHLTQIEQSYNDAVESSKSGYITKNNNINFYAEQIVNKMLEHIENNYMDETLSLELFSDKYNISVSYLSKIFKNVAKVNFVNYLINKRIAKAKILLEQSNDPLNILAVKVGYGNYNSFMRAFKKTTGLSPGEYKKRLSLQ
ncbi:MAG: helix-turn-helix domain-containing protein [Firmicutes bacterium]|nr:helix-turn-helix domain-containing protein [Bacillota bacterium]